MDIAAYNIEGFLKISDLKSGEILVDKKNAIHFGNLTPTITEVLAGFDTSHLRYMAFGNGGTTMATNSETVYKAPNVSKSRNTSDSLYSEVHILELTPTSEENIDNSTYSLPSNSRYSDIVLSGIFDFNDISELQDEYDRLPSYDEVSIIDEIAIYSGPSAGDIRLSDSSRHSMVTHVIFHPIQKSKNRRIKIDYVIRVYLVANRYHAGPTTPLYQTPIEPLPA